MKYILTLSILAIAGCTTEQALQPQTTTPPRTKIIIGADPGQTGHAMIPFGSKDLEIFYGIRTDTLSRYQAGVSCNDAPMQLIEEDSIGGIYHMRAGAPGDGRFTVSNDSFDLAGKTWPIRVSTSSNPCNINNILEGTVTYLKGSFFTPGPFLSPATVQPGRTFGMDLGGVYDAGIVQKPDTFNVHVINPLSRKDYYLHYIPNHGLSWRDTVPDDALPGKYRIRYVYEHLGCEPGETDWDLTVE